MLYYTSADARFIWCGYILVAVFWNPQEDKLSLKAAEPRVHMVGCLWLVSIHSILTQHIQENEMFSLTTHDPWLYKRQCNVMSSVSLQQPGHCLRVTWRPAPDQGKLWPHNHSHWSVGHLILLNQTSTLRWSIKPAQTHKSWHKSLPLALVHLDPWWSSRHSLVWQCKYKI